MICVNKGGSGHEFKYIKRYINAALAYAILAMAGGVFYREFTKYQGFTARTTLGVVHTHYFLLGMLFFLLLLVLEKNFSFTEEKTKRVFAVYHIGLNLTAAMFCDPWCGTSAWHSALTRHGMQRFQVLPESDI